MICWNQIEETLYPNMWVCEQFCCKILVQNGGYSLFQAWSLTLQSNTPFQHEHWPFLPDLHQKMWFKEFLLHIDQALIGSPKTGHVGVFKLRFATERLTNTPTPLHGDLPWLVEYPFNIHIKILLMMTQINEFFVILQHSHQRNRRPYPQS